MIKVSDVRGRVQELARGSATVDLRWRVRALEAEVQECRQLNLRLAELTDLVTELLLPAVQRDEERLAELLARYHESL